MVFTSTTNTDRWARSLNISVNRQIIGVPLLMAIDRPSGSPMGNKSPAGPMLALSSDLPRRVTYDTSTRVRVVGAYWDYNAYLRGCDFVPSAATATQRSPALWRQDPSGRDLYGQG
jgi:hypothetical protein